MNNHKITIRTFGSTAVDTYTIKENEIVTECGLTCYDAVQKLANETFNYFCRNADFIVSEGGQQQLIEYEMIDTQSPIGTSTHLRSVKTYYS